MTGFDIAVLLFVGLGAISGFWRGFVHEILSLGSWIFAVLTIRMLHTPVTYWLLDYVGSQSGAAVLAFALLLIVPVMAIKMVAKWAGKMSRASVLGPIDRVLGLGFGAVKGVIIVVLAFSVIVLGYDTVWGVEGRPDWIRSSRTYPFINAASDELVEIIAEQREHGGLLGTEEPGPSDAPGEEEG